MVTWPGKVFRSFLDAPEDLEGLIARRNYFDEGGKRIYCGILILGSGRSDGFFAYDYGRHLAYLPGAKAVVDSMLEQAVGQIIQEGIENTCDGRWRCFFPELYERLGLVATPYNGVGVMLLDKLRQSPETAEVTMDEDRFEIHFHLNYCQNFQTVETAPSPSVLYQVIEDGKQTDLVCGCSIPLPVLLEQAASISATDKTCFADALKRAVCENGGGARQIWLDEADALVHDLGCGGQVKQRGVIDLDTNRIGVSYDHQGGNFQESLEALKRAFPLAAVENQWGLPGAV